MFVALLDKYARIRELRLASDPKAPATRAAVRALASAFPGALRDLDRLPLHVIESRMAELDACATSNEPPAPWMSAQTLFHHHARELLAIKRWLRGRRILTDDIVTNFVAAFPEVPRERARAELERVASPPRGRLIDLVHARVGEALGTTADHARALVNDEHVARNTGEPNADEP